MQVGPAKGQWIESHFSFHDREDFRDLFAFNRWHFAIRPDQPLDTIEDRRPPDLTSGARGLSTWRGG